MYVRTCCGATRMQTGRWDIGREDVHDRHSRITQTLSRHKTHSEEMCMRMDKCAQTEA